MVKDFWTGRGLAALVASTVTIITLSFPDLNVETAAFYYFLVGSIASIGTSVLNYYFINMDVLKARDHAEEAGHKGSPKERLPLWDLLKVVKVPCITVILVAIVGYIIFPAITSNLKPMKSEPQVGRY